MPDHVERNTGLKARYNLVDNGDGTITFAGWSLADYRLKWRTCEKAESLNFECLPCNV